MGNCTSSSIKETSPPKKADSRAPVPAPVPTPTPTVPPTILTSIPETKAISEEEVSNANEQAPVEVENITLESSSNIPSDEKSEEKVDVSEGRYVFLTTIDK